MENTLSKYRAPLFADWGSDVSAALAYVAQLSSASAEGPAINTAAHVLLNTVINAVDKMLAASSPEKLAILDLIDDRISAWMDSNLHDKVSDELDSWADDNLSERMDSWAENNIGDCIDSWMDDNLGDKINDIDLVVRVK
jgi:ABC-type molybdate transport system ATPase subunit